MPAPLDIEQILASAVHFLLGGDETKAAAALLACQVEYDVWGFNDENDYCSIALYLRAPRPAYNLLDNDEDKFRSIQHALHSVVPIHVNLQQVYLRGMLVTVDADWRKDVLAQLEGNTILNQAADAPAARIWKNRKRSPTLFEWGAAMAPRCPRAPLRPPPPGGPSATVLAADRSPPLRPSAERGEPRSVGPNKAAAEPYGEIAQ